MDFNEQLGFKTSAGIRASLMNIQEYPFHFHQNYIEIICVVKGRIKIYDSAVNYTLSANEMHIFNSSDPHKITAIDNPEDALVLTVHIDKNKYLTFYDNLPIAYFVCHSTNPNNIFLPEMNLLRMLMSKAYFEYIERKASAINLDSIAHEILTLLYDQFHYYAYKKLSTGSYQIVRRKYDGRNEKEFYRIYNIADYVEYNYMNNLKLTDIAKIEFLSVPYLSKYIKANIGINFSELLSIARCAQAERLLANTNKSIESISAEVGFTSRNHLFTHFNKWLAQSPSSYRKMILRDLGSDVVIKYSMVDAESAEAILDSYLNS